MGIIRKRLHYCIQLHTSTGVRPVSPVRSVPSVRLTVPVALIEVCEVQLVVVLQQVVQAQLVGHPPLSNGLRVRFIVSVSDREWAEGIRVAGVGFGVSDRDRRSIVNGSNNICIRTSIRIPSMRNWGRTDPDLVVPDPNCCVCVCV